jgi:hypothetical protein
MHLHLFLLCIFSSMSQNAQQGMSALDHASDHQEIVALLTASDVAVAPLLSSSDSSL